MAVHTNTSLPDDQPIIGQNIHFVLDGGICTAAIVTAVDETDPYKIHLRYFSPDSSIWQHDVEADLNTPTDGTWHTVGVG